MTSTIVALDLGATQIRAVEAEIKNGKPPKIKKVFSLPLPSDVISSGEIVNADDLTKALKEIWGKAKFSSKYVVSMSGGDALDTRIKEIPWVTDEDLPKVLSYYIKDDVLLGDSDEFYYGAHTLTEYFRQPDNKPDAAPEHKKLIVLTAVKRTYVDSFNKVVEAAGLRPYVIDALPLALIRATTTTNDIPENANVVSIEIGGEVVTIVVHRNYQPYYINSAPLLGGTRVTAEIAGTIGVSLIEAELLKTSFSVPAEHRNQLRQTIIEEDGSVREVEYSDFSNAQKETAAGIISREVTNLVGHIGDILEDAFTDSTPFRIILSGGGAGLHTLLGRIQAELGVPTTVIQPFENYAGKLPEEMVINQHVYAALFGLIVGQDETK